MNFTNILWEKTAPNSQFVKSHMTSPATGTLWILHVFYLSGQFGWRVNPSIIVSREHALDISCEHSFSIFSESDSKQFGLLRLLRILSGNHWIKNPFRLTSSDGQHIVHYMRSNTPVFVHINLKLPASSWRFLYVWISCLHYHQQMRSSISSKQEFLTMSSPDFGAFACKDLSLHMCKNSLRQHKKYRILKNI